MKIKKLKLSEFKVQSYITSLDKKRNHPDGIRGGSSYHGVCPTAEVALADSNCGGC